MTNTSSERRKTIQFYSICLCICTQLISRFFASCPELVSKAQSCEYQQNIPNLSD